MTEMTAEALAEILAARHRKLEQFTLDMPPGRERDIDFAYAVQDRLIPLIAPAGIRRAGYKIGVTTPRMQEMCGIPEPIAGVVLRERLLQSPARIEAGKYARVGIESEIAIRIGTTLPADARLADSQEFADHLDAATAAFEIVDDSNADYKRLSGVKLIADNGWNAGLVLGTPKPLKGVRNLAGLTGKLAKNGKPFEQGTSNDVLGDPFNAVRWLHKHLARRGAALNAGEWITTGSLIPTQFAVPGESYRWEVEGFGAVEVAVA